MITSVQQIPGLSGTATTASKPISTRTKENSATAVYDATSVAISSNGKGVLAVAQDVMSRYDLHNISYNNLIKLGHELRDNGLISSEEMLDMTAPSFDDSTLPGNSPSDARSSPDMQHDFVGMYENLLAFTKHTNAGDTKSIAWLERTVSLFQNFAALQG